MDSSKLFLVREHFERNAQLFFEREIKPHLKDKSIFNDESIDVLNDLVLERIRQIKDEKERLVYVALAGMYLGQYVIANTKAKWISEKNCPFTFPYMFSVKYEDNRFRPFASIFNRVKLEKHTSLVEEINIIKSIARHWAKRA